MTEAGPSAATWQPRPGGTVESKTEKDQDEDEGAGVTRNVAEYQRELVEEFRGSLETFGPELLLRLTPATSVGLLATGRTGDACRAKLRQVLEHADSTGPQVNKAFLAAVEEYHRRLEPVAQEVEQELRQSGARPEPGEPGSLRRAAVALVAIRRHLAEQVRVQRSRPPADAPTVMAADVLLREFCLLAQRVLRPVARDCRSGFVSCAHQLGVEEKEVVRMIVEHLRRRPESLAEYFTFMTSPRSAAQRIHDLIGDALLGTGCFGDGHAKVLAEVTGRRVLIVLGPGYPKRALRVYQRTGPKGSAPSCAEFHVDVIGNPELAVTTDDIVLYCDGVRSGRVEHLDPLVPAASPLEVFESLPVVADDYQEAWEMSPAALSATRCGQVFQGMDYGPACLLAILGGYIGDDETLLKMRFREAFGFWSPTVWEVVRSAVAAMHGADAFFSPAQPVAKRDVPSPPLWRGGPPRGVNEGADAKRQRRAPDLAAFVAADASNRLGLAHLDELRCVAQSCWDALDGDALSPDEVAALAARMRTTFCERVRFLLADVRAGGPRQHAAALARSLVTRGLGLQDIVGTIEESESDLQAVVRPFARLTVTDATSERAREEKSEEKPSAAQAVARVTDLEGQWFAVLELASASAAHATAVAKDHGIMREATEADANHAAEHGGAARKIFEALVEDKVLRYGAFAKIKIEDAGAERPGL